jgi:hypothetical protein
MLSLRWISPTGIPFQRPPISNFFSILKINASSGSDIAPIADVHQPREIKMEYTKQSDFSNESSWRLSSAVRQWLALLLIISAVILYPERPAWGGGFEVSAGSDGISGFAQAAPLGQVLGTLAERAGFTVYIDEKLVKAPVSFTLPAALPAEQAIQRMVHPHSYAVVFTKLPSREKLAVEQVKVYTKGDRSASFVKMSDGHTGIPMTGYARGGYVRSDVRLSSGVRSGLSAVRQQVKAPVRFKENAVGFTGFAFDDIRHGPDYRRDTLAMARDYQAYRQEREAYGLRAKNAQMEAAKQHSQNRQSAHRAQRQSSIQQTTNQDYQ